MEHFEDDIIAYDWDKDVFIVTIKPGVRMDADRARQMVKTRLGLVHGEAYPVLMRGATTVSFTKDGRDFLSTDESIEGVKAAALLADNAVKATMANFFLKVTVKKPKVPTRIFNNEAKALQWLAQYR